MLMQVSPNTPEGYINGVKVEGSPAGDAVAALAASHNNDMGAGGKAPPVQTQVRDDYAGAAGIPAKVGNAGVDSAKLAAIESTPIEAWKWPFGTSAAPVDPMRFTVSK